MDINELTIGQAKELKNLFSATGENLGINNFQIGKVVLVRTYSAGVWAGLLKQKCKDEVILTNARRMWRFFCEKSISISGVANYGIDQSKSKIAPPVSEVWLMPIEIIPFSNAQAEKSVMESSHAVAE